jgi:hypothetical protein
LSKTNRAITKLLAIDWLSQHAAAVMLGGAAFGIVAVFLVNADGAFREETALVDFTFHTPTKYSAAHYVMMAELQDGRVVALAMPNGLVPPAPGKQIRVRRITLLFFGERFVWLGETLAPTP